MYVSSDKLTDAQPQLPDAVVMVAKADLRRVLSAADRVAMSLGGQAARRRLHAALGADVRPGDVWKDKDGTRWFARTGVDGKLWLSSENTNHQPAKSSDVSLRDMELEWRRGG